MSTERQRFSTVREIEAWKPKQNNDTKSISICKGLYVRGQLTGLKSFYTRPKGTWLKIGDFGAITLKQAVEMVTHVRSGLRKGGDLDVVREALRVCHNPDDFQSCVASIGKKRNEAASPTVDDLVEPFLAKLEPNLAIGGSRRRYRSMYNHHFRSEFGQTTLAEMTRKDVYEHLCEVYRTCHPTAVKLSAFLRRVFKEAISLELISTSPIPDQEVFVSFRHVPKSHPTIDHHRLPLLWERVRHSGASASTKGVILLGLTTAMRLGVIRKTRQNHIDFESGLWVIPAAANQDVDYRMKSGREFQIGLPTTILHALRELLKLDSEETPEQLLFPGARATNSPITDVAVNKLIKKYEPNLTFHGLRNSIKIWGRDNGFQDYIMDAYCDHELTGLDKAYRRENTFQKRLAVAEALSQYILRS